MSLEYYKWTAAATILGISIISGFISLRFASRHQKVLQLGDAAANGIFLGVALFHLLPHAVDGFISMGAESPVFFALFIATVAFLLIFFLENSIHSFNKSGTTMISATALTLTLSIHALVAGIALGISESLAIISVIFLAILAHKSFELFALVIKLVRLKINRKFISIIFLLFAWVTPLGIWLGALSDTMFAAHTDSLITTCFDAIAAGTFIYVGGFHQHKHEYHPVAECYHEYTQALMTIAGVILMAFLAIWI